MPKVISISKYIPPFQINQLATKEIAQELFKDKITNLDRYLRVFENTEIEKRHFTKNVDWYKQEHTFEEKNNIYIESSVQYGSEAIKKCLHNDVYLNEQIHFEEIDAIFFISSTGIATPTIEAKIMNILPFANHTKRIPIWGLGCAGGVAGLSRAFDYCKAYPHSKVIVLSIELCSLTFQKNDASKSNIVGMSLFADGVAALCVVGDEVNADQLSTLNTLPHISCTQSVFMKKSEDIMGWDVTNDGLSVIFSRHIPTLVNSWLSPVVHSFLEQHDLNIDDINHFIAHPGGKKVIEAYKSCLHMSDDLLQPSLTVLQQYGNMSSPTVLYVLDLVMRQHVKQGSIGLAIALGPGFSAELALLTWK
ncbi:type III polyketide synthase [Bacillus sp. SCS-151]|uniref:type III polyketide synthase n=1 Tax=Nanhaiella sioensis TaxID=3115293 RepID=UPI0039799C08